MADDLSNYKLQLQQVEVALLSEENNPELLKLKTDLEEVIELTKDLIKNQIDEQKKSYVETSIGGDERTSGYYKDKKNAAPSKIWKVTDKCMAKWTEDGQYYEATIEAITDFGEVSVCFDLYQNRSTTTIKELKECKVRIEVFPANSNKRARPNQKEYLKKKKQKKMQRFKDLEDEREVEKNKWLSFSTKTNKKSSFKAQSIFASPDTVSGKVGVGTCGVSGKGMTEYHRNTEKYKKGI